VSLVKFLDNYEAFDEEEKSDVEEFKFFLKNFDKEDWAVRDNTIGHLTASAWVVNKDRTKVLFAYHNIFDSWAWLGGHADGDFDLLNVATKEAKEESGIKNIKPVFETPIDISVNAVGSHYKREKYVSSHLHYNSVYLFEADESDELVVAEGENSDVAWLHIDELLDKVSEDHIKVIYKRIMKKVA